MSVHLTDEQRDLVASGRSEPSLDAHVASCGECQKSVRDAKARQRLLTGLTPYTLSDMAFRRVEARLMEQVEDGLPTPWPAWLKLAVPVLLAAVALFVVVPWRSETTVQPSPVAQRVTPKTFPTMVATFASADAKLRHGDGAWQPLVASDEVSSGAAVSASRLVLATLTGPRLVLEGEGAFVVGGQAMVVLGAGAVGAVGDAEVLAGARRLTSVDAAFHVERTAAEVVLDVATGAVTVFDEGGVAKRVVQGPARVRWADGTALDQGVLEPQSAWLPPLAPRAPASKLDLSGLPDGTLLSVDGHSYGATPFSFMLDAGRHAVLVTPPGQPTQERFVDLVGGQPFVFALSPTAEREAEAPEPDARALARVMEDLRRQTPKLRACYEKWLKANPHASGTVDLVLVVNAKGAVKKADVKGDPISAESVACLKTTAKSLVLSPLGSEQELEVPLVLTPGKK
ncbi:MAG: PEGA domain-containing protein [Myxococcaceae bacterium]|nr:PEGA domain-containing protein [Myxococcaceae bacterium]